MYYIVESLDELGDIVVPLFADVENKNVQAPEWLDHPFGLDQLKVSNQYTCIPVFCMIIFY